MLFRSEIADHNATDTGADFYKGVGVFTIVQGVVLAGVGIPLALSSTSVQLR